MYVCTWALEVGEGKDLKGLTQVHNPHLLLQVLLRHEWLREEGAEHVEGFPEFRRLHVEVEEREFAGGRGVRESTICLQSMGIRFRESNC